MDILCDIFFIVEKNYLGITLQSYLKLWNLADKNKHKWIILVDVEFFKQQKNLIDVWQMV